MARRHRLSLERRIRLVELRACGTSWAEIKRGNDDSEADVHRRFKAFPGSVPRLQQTVDDTLSELSITSDPARVAIERTRVLRTLDAIVEEAWRLHRLIEDPRTLRVVLDAIAARVALLGLRIPQQAMDDAELSASQLGLVWLPIKDARDAPHLTPALTPRSKTNGAIPS